MDDRIKAPKNRGVPPDSRPHVIAVLRNIRQSLPCQAPKLRLWHFPIVVFLLSAAAFAALEWNTRHFRDMIIESIYGSKPHRVPCDELPTPEEVRRVLDEHAHIVGQIEAVNPGFTRVEVNTFSCVDRADIRILYATASDREQIRALLGDAESFFGVPYRMHNT